jgi:hypothetical protein
VSAIGHIILATILAFRIRVWIGLAALGMRMGWSRLVDHALARANRLQDDFLLLGLENDLKAAANRQTDAALPGAPNAYSVIEAGNAGFQVIEVQPDGGEPRVLAAFTTRAAATDWLSDLLGLPKASDDVEDYPFPPFHP